MMMMMLMVLPEAELNLQQRRTSCDTLFVCH